METEKPTLLWISDACAPTGFARVTHNVLGWLGSRWRRVVLGVNHRGDPHTYPYEIFPAIAGGDLWGFKRFPKLVQRYDPAVVVIQSDAWIVQSFLKIVEQATELRFPPLVAFMPVDGRGMKRSTVKALEGLDRAIFYTRFGERQALEAGFAGRSAVIGLGVRRELYKPQDRRASRAKLLPHLSPDAFLVGNVNRNQPRKRLDLTLKYFGEWIRRGADAHLYLHAITEDVGWDLIELAHWYGIADRVHMPKARTFDELFDEAEMPRVYSMLDVQISTSLGEGWGLPTLEGMACGVAQVVPDWAALGEWPRGAVRYLEVEPGEANVGQKAFGLGAVANQECFIEALEDLRQNREKLAALGRAGLELASEPEFEWKHVALRMDAELRRVLEERRRHELTGESDGSTADGRGRPAAHSAM